MAVLMLTIKEIMKKMNSNSLTLSDNLIHNSITKTIRKNMSLMKNIKGING
jgi:hypothetical protein